MTRQSSELIWLVARREIRDRARAKSFWVASVILLVAVAAAVIIPALTHGSRATARVGIVGGPVAALTQTVKEAGRVSGTTVTVVPLPGVTAARAKLRSGDLAAVLIGDKDPRLFAGQLRDQLDPHRRVGPIGVQEAIDAAVAQDAVDSVPGGLDGVLDERALGLSGGQRQRIALARALLADPQILILDEPTSAVDAYTEARIAETLRVHRAGKTTIVMTTSPLILDRADRVVLLQGNRIVADGRHRDLMSGDAQYRSVVTRDEETA